MKTLKKIIVSSLVALGFFVFNRTRSFSNWYYLNAKAARKDVKPQEKAYCAFFAAIRTAALRQNKCNTPDLITPYDTSITSAIC